MSYVEESEIGNVRNKVREFLKSEMGKNIKLLFSEGQRVRPWHKAYQSKGDCPLNSTFSIARTALHYNEQKQQYA